MRPERDEQLSEALLALLGEAAFLRFVETFGGLRLYIPTYDPHRKIADAIGADAADKLISAYGRAHIYVPLARELRAQHYRSCGLTHQDIARRLGITESGVERLLKRTGRRERQANANQLNLFG